MSNQPLITGNLLFVYLWQQRSSTLLSTLLSKFHLRLLLGFFGCVCDSWRFLQPFSLSQGFKQENYGLLKKKPLPHSYGFLVHSFPKIQPISSEKSFNGSWHYPLHLQMELNSLNDVGTLLKVDWFINFNTLIEGSTFTRLNDVGTLLKVDWFINFNASIEGSTFTRLNVSTLPDDFTAFLMVNFHIGTISCLFCAFLARNRRLSNCPVCVSLYFWTRNFYWPLEIDWNSMKL